MTSTLGATPLHVLRPHGAQHDHLGHAQHTKSPVHAWMGQDNSMSPSAQKIDLFGSRTGSDGTLYSCRKSYRSGYGVCGIDLLRLFIVLQ